jgi:hypothetical protein
LVVVSCVLSEFGQADKGVRVTSISGMLIELLGCGKIPDT